MSQKHAGKAKTIFLITATNVMHIITMKSCESDGQNSILLG